MIEELEPLYYTPNLRKDQLLEIIHGSLPSGWHKLGEQFIEELWEELDRSNLHSTYEVDQCKEKYGEMRWYDSRGNDETDRLIKKYEYISYHTCCKCGKTATWLSNGWICPYCDNCVPDKAYATRFMSKELPFYGYIKH